MELTPTPPSVTEAEARRRERAAFVHGASVEAWKINAKITWDLEDAVADARKMFPGLPPPPKRSTPLSCGKAKVFDVTQAAVRYADAALRAYTARREGDYLERRTATFAEDEARFEYRRALRIARRAEARAAAAKAGDANG